MYALHYELQHHDRMIVFGGRSSNNAVFNDVFMLHSGKDDPVAAVFLFHAWLTLYITMPHS